MMMRRYFGLVAVALTLVLGSRATAALSHGDDAADAVGKMLDAWHAAAARADEEAYFAHFASNAVFLGTDGAERWTLDEFRAYAHPHFAKGTAWTLRPMSRHVSVGVDGGTAWFDEALETPHMGPCRGSGVALLKDGVWRIAQYNLSIPIPNDLVEEFVARIAEHGAAAGGAIRIMSFNIRYDNAGDKEDRWEKRRENVAAFIREQAPDVLGLQEALHGQLEFLKGELPEMGVVGVGRDDGKTRGEYAAIMYKKEKWRVDESGTFWFSDTPEEPGTKNWGNRVVRICTWARFLPAGESGDEGGAFYMFNLHIDHQSQESREKSVALLAERIAARAHDDPVVVTGDFNSGERNPAVLAMKGELPGREAPVRFVDSFRVAHPDERIVGTFNSFRGEREGDKIDYIFVLPGTTVKEATIHRDSVEGRYLSDHFPISATIVAPKGTR